MLLISGSSKFIIKQPSADSQLVSAPNTFENISLLKKPHLDPGSLTNYRPVSNLPFFSEVLESVKVSQQLSGYLLSNNLLEPFQQLSEPVTPPKLQTAFDTTDHGIFLDRLESQFGISGLALAWLKS